MRRDDMQESQRGAYSPDEAAAWLGCSRDTLDRLIQRGELRSFKIGRRRFISLQALKDFVIAREAEANGS